MSPPVTSTRLLEGIKCRDDDAWERMVSLYGPLIYLRCRQQGLQECDADEIVQEVFEAVMASIDSFRRDRPNDSFRKWLTTIAHNKIRDRFRRQHHRAKARGGTTAQMFLAEIPQQSPAPSALDQPLGEDGALEQRLKELVRTRVSEQTWRAFYEVAVLGRRVADVADELGITPHAVYDAKYRVPRIIREEFGELID